MGRSIAKYGRAHAFTLAARCVESKRAFEEYATFVDKDDPLAAKMARATPPTATRRVARAVRAPAAFGA